MKKLLLLITVLIVISSCNSAKKEREKKKQDSIDFATDAFWEKKHEEEDSLFLLTDAGKIWKKHPKWSKEDCKKVLAGKIWIGMHIDMIREERGRADNKNVSDYGHGKEYQWCWNDYTPSCFYGKEDGIITSYN